MRAIVYRSDGSPDVLRCEEFERRIPGDDEVLIGVRAGVVNPLAWNTMKGGLLIVRWLLGLGKPKIKRPGVTRLARWKGLAGT